MLYLLKQLLEKFANDKNDWKFRDHSYYTGTYKGTTHSICNFKFNVSNEIPVVVHNGSNYNYYFIRKKLVKKCKEKFQCLGENTEK